MVIVVIYLLSSIKILREYERGVIFRLGRLLAQPKGPGVILVFAPIDRMVRVSLRIDTLEVPAQDVVTRDNVTVKVNAVIYFRVIDPRLAVVEVSNFLYATSQLAQTTLRSVLGEVELDELLSQREKLNVRLQSILDQHTSPWGVKVTMVEVKQVDLAGADDPRHRAAGRGGTRAARQNHSRRRRIHGRGEAGHGGGGDPEAAGGHPVAVFADAGGNRRGKEHHHRVPAAAGYNYIFGARAGPGRQRRRARRRHTRKRHAKQRHRRIRTGGGQPPIAERFLHRGAAASRWRSPWVTSWGRTRRDRRRVQPEGATPTQRRPAGGRGRSAASPAPPPEPHSRRPPRRPMRTAAPQTHAGQRPPQPTTQPARRNRPAAAPRPPPAAAPAAALRRLAGFPRRGLLLAGDGAQPGGGRGAWSGLSRTGLSRLITPGRNNLMRVLVGPYNDTAVHGPRQDPTGERRASIPSGNSVSDSLVQIGAAAADAPRASPAARVGAQEPHAFRIAQPAEERSSPAQPAHRVRIGALPQYPRVLPSRRRHLHDSGRPLHARLRVLLRAQAQSRGATTCALDPAEPANVARMAAEMQPALRGDHQRESRRPGGRRLAPFRRDRAPGAARPAAGPRGSADARFLRRSGCRGARARCRAARLQPQHGDRAAAVPPRAPAGRLPRSRWTCWRSPGGIAADALTKSGFMVGLGETEDEVRALLRDLRAAGTDVATIGQYLQPTRRNLPVAEYIAPRSSTAYREYGLSLGFKMVFSGPLVRSSYMADAVSDEAARRASC